MNQKFEMPVNSEIIQMVNATAYKENCMRGLLLLKILVEEYEAECIFKSGSSPIKQVDYRIKSAESIIQKLQKNNCHL